jgi:hypothetical protein
MQSRRSDKQSKSKASFVKSKLVKGFILFVFIVVSLIFMSILWKEPVIAPDQSIPSKELPLSDTTKEDAMMEPIEPEEPPPLTPDEIQVIEDERMRLINLELERGYYKGLQSGEIAISSEWTLMPDTVSPGDVLLVRHHAAEEITWGDKTYKLQKFGTGYYTYLPISSGIEPGEYQIGDQTLTVLDKSFETQHLEVSSKMESMRRDTDRIQADQLKINKARSQSEAEFLFPPDSDFVQPVKGRLSTPFGNTRYINGNLSGRHMAIDLAAPEGTPIMTTNEGIVVLAEELYLTGNAIYIDHGMGLFSQYAHLSELHVETGDRVEHGQIIGLVGTTGFSTGPHLHFTFWAHNVPVNPNLFFEKTPFYWLETDQNP